MNNYIATALLGSTDEKRHVKILNVVNQENMRKIREKNGSKSILDK